MSLRNQLKAIDEVALATSFSDLSSSSWARLRSDELPIEYFDLTSRFPVIQRIGDTCLAGMLQATGDPHRAHIVSSGGFMTAAVVGRYAEMHSSPSLESIEIGEVSSAFDEFHNRLAGGYGPVLDEWETEYPFAISLFDLACTEAVESGFPKRETRYFADGAIRAAGTLITIGERQ